VQQTLQIHASQLRSADIDAIGQGGNDIGSNHSSGTVKNMLACAATQPAMGLLKLFRRHFVYGVAIRATGDPAHAGILGRSSDQRALVAVIKIQPSSASATSSAIQGA